jgi:hypothetical protein
VTWAQTITIVVPILIAIVAGIFYGNKQTDLVARMVGDLRTDINARFASVDARFAGVEGRFASLESRFDRLETKFENRFEKIDQNLHELRVLIVDVLRPRAS